MKPAVTPNSPWHWLSYSMTGEHSDQNWYWLPGWSFDALVFESLIAELPGQHWVMRWSDHHGSFDDCAQALAQAAAPNAIWVGWSLGGAIALRAASKTIVSQRAVPKAVVTLASGRRFCKPDANTPWGMAPEVFADFQQGLKLQPEKTLKRFLMLCAQGYGDRKALVSRLGEYQHCAEDHNLEHSLAWLADYDLSADVLALSEANVAMLHLHGSDDTLAPGGLQGAQLLGYSHALHLENEQQQPLLSLLDRLRTSSQPS